MTSHCGNVFSMLKLESLFDEQYMLKGWFDFEAALVNAQHPRILILAPQRLPEIKRIDYIAVTG